MTILTSETERKREGIVIVQKEAVIQLGWERVRTCTYIYRVHR